MQQKYRKEFPDLFMSSSDVLSAGRSSKDGNKDLDILYCQKKSHIDFKLQTNRPEFQSNSKLSCHEDRFNYFDPGLVFNSTKNFKKRTVNFEHFSPHKDPFANRQSHPLTDNDKRALQQGIFQHQSYLNDLPSSPKDILQKKLRNHSINFDKALIRDGVVIKRDGFIITNKGTQVAVNEDDPSQILLRAQNEQRQNDPKNKSQELDVISAYKHQGSYKRNLINIDFENQMYRDRLPNTKLPGFMQYTGQEHTMNILSDKMMKMNNYNTNPRFMCNDSSFNT